MIKKSAVVVLHDESSDSLILTKRSLNMRRHPGEICFPGGGWESHDQDLWSTALRELHEELGIENTRVELIKALHPEKTLIGTIIYPWLASIPQLNPFKMNENEVAGILTLPMKDVVIADNYQDVIIKKRGYSIKSCQFKPSNAHFVWGATARIMKQLSE